MPYAKGDGFGIAADQFICVGFGIWRDTRADRVMDSPSPRDGCWVLPHPCRFKNGIRSCIIMVILLPVVILNIAG